VAASSSPISEASARTIVFDAYGTLFDVQSVVAVCERQFPGHGAELSHLWRQKQLEYSWLATLMDRYEDFTDLTRRALGFAVASLGLPALDTDGQSALTGEYGHLRPFPEVPDTLRRLSPTHRLAILSNGTEAMLQEVLLHSGMRDRFAAVLSVDRIRRYKPAPDVYRMVPERMGVPMGRAIFVSANGWDVAGARSAGLRVVWVNRRDQPPERIGPPADWTVRSLAELPSLPLP
jgi:2-haloacid dehalogenase